MINLQTAQDYLDKNYPNLKLWAKVVNGDVVVFGKIQYSFQLGEEDSVSCIPDRLNEALTEVIKLVETDVGY